MDKIDVVENFYGVYLLKSLNPQYKGRTYIGFTVDPNRRIKQHNRGKKFGGAWKTSRRGPWEMVLVVHGFPSEVSALRFEWAWQHPKRSRRLKFLIRNKKASEASLDYNIRLMFLMLSIPPWNRLPLTLRWLSADAAVDAPPNLQPPPHMPVTYGSVKTKKAAVQKKKEDKAESSSEPVTITVCDLCDCFISEVDLLTCLNQNCKAAWHICCIADKFLEDESKNAATDGTEVPTNRVLPVEGCCTQCKYVLLWGDLIRKKRGCYQDTQQDDNASFSSASTILMEDYIRPL